MNSIAQRITSALATLCADVLQTGGYHTDAGLRVYRGRQQFSPDDLANGPLIVLGPAAEGEFDAPLRAEPQKHRNTLTHAITAYALPTDPDNPMDTGHALLADLKRALFRTDAPRPVEGGEILGEEYRYQGGAVTLPEAGEHTVSASITVAVGYSERRGDPTIT